MSDNGAKQNSVMGQMDAVRWIGTILILGLFVLFLFGMMLGCSAGPGVGSYPEDQDPDQEAGGGGSEAKTDASSSDASSSSVGGNGGSDEPTGEGGNGGAGGAVSDGGSATTGPTCTLASGVCPAAEPNQFFCDAAPYAGCVSAGGPNDAGFAPWCCAENCVRAIGYDAQGCSGDPAYICKQESAGGGCYLSQIYSNLACCPQ